MAEGSNMLRRREVTATLLANRGDLLAISGLGGAIWDVAAAGDVAENFYLWGAMGGAAPIGLGLALAQPERRVLVIAGDGEMLMGLGGLATVAVQRPTNLAIAILDNERYGETGMQPTHTSEGVDLAAVAAAAGFAETALVTDQEGLEAAVPLLREAPGPVMVVIKVGTEPLGIVMPPRDGAYLKDRFRAALLGPGAAT